MSFVLNEYDVADVHAYLQDRDDLPNLRKAASVQRLLVLWTNDVSDGWPYWRKPSNASGRLQERLALVLHDRYRTDDHTDLTEAELRSLLAPIKAFLTRHGAGYWVVGL